MAGDWIKIEHTLPTKPEVMQIADRLGIPDDQVVGLLVRFWSWVDANMSPECPVSYGTTERIGRLVLCENFADAMIEVGWLSVENSRVLIPNYDHHLSQSAKRRGVESKKKKRQRQNLSRSAGDKNGTREEKRREESTRTPIVPLDEDERVTEMDFVAAWNAIKGVRPNRGDFLTPKRRKVFRARTKTPGWLDDAKEAMKKFPLQCFEEGDDWKPDMEWFLRPDSVTKILEGKYDWRKNENHRGAVRPADKARVRQRDYSHLDNAGKAGDHAPHGTGDPDGSRPAT